MSTSIGGVPVIVSQALPVTPTTPETCARIVRHHLRHVLEAVGEDVGPRPDESAHAFMLGRTLVVSPAMFATLAVKS